ncbi:MULTISPECIES: hypothetical protein [Halorubrum]|uniref:Uncharacterized protein n=1 Tax=Halorubrum sodomense TaxID=35743 RepID=A0A1I6H644_HALSD|nr:MULTISPECIES: hypothetical protein [Halorubrum]TKX71496.1 hypothetical protein EXE45_01085 [Halorubrum sp. SP9]SFR49840.1 hypothetical protein SAMN04487937_2482 [Halorubrum sodomense]
MTDPVPVAVPRKGRPLEAVLERVAAVADDDRIDRLADTVSNTLRYEKAVTKGAVDADDGPYERLAEYSDPTTEAKPEFTLLRDDRNGKPRRIVFDAATVDLGGVTVTLVGREEPFRALRTHEFALGFDSADLVLEEVVGIRATGLGNISDINDRIDPVDTDVRVVGGLGDTVYHTLMGRENGRAPSETFDRAFLVDYEGPLCISPRYERLVTAVLGTDALDGVEFVYPEADEEEEAAIARVGLGVYLTVTGSTAREHGLSVGEQLFPSETVLMRNAAETAESVSRVLRALDREAADSEIRV